MGFTEEEVLNFPDKGKFTTYWANTSSNSLVGKLLREGSEEIKSTMEDLPGKRGSGRPDPKIRFCFPGKKVLITSERICIAEEKTGK